MYILQLKLNQISKIDKKNKNYDDNGLQKFTYKIEQFNKKFIWKQFFPRLFNEIFRSRDIRNSLYEQNHS